MAKIYTSVEFPENIKQMYADSWKSAYRRCLNPSWLPSPKQHNIVREKTNKQTKTNAFLLIWTLFTELLLPDGVINEMNRGKGFFYYFL